MVKFDIQAIRFLDAQHFRLLTAVEMGMKNHELVPLSLISSISNIHRGAASRVLNDLTRNRLVVYERGKKFDGYRLATLGYDFLALHALSSRDIVCSVGNQIGVGKESDIYVGGDSNSQDLILKLHRLGRTSFRKIKEKRDYHRRRHYCSWLYLSRLAATKEFAFLHALHAHKFPVPTPIDINRHIVIMEMIMGPPLCQVSHLSDPPTLFEKLMKLIIRLASYGLIHGDFNEFNIMIIEDENPIIIDFPQMVSIDHPNAEFYFNRDVQCVRTFFQRKFHFDSQEWPKFNDIRRRKNLDLDLEASGFTKEMCQDLNKAYDQGNFMAHLDEEESSSKKSDDNSDNDDDNEEEGEAKKEIIKEQQVPQLTNSIRFQNWLEEARGELETLQLEQAEMKTDENGEQLMEKANEEVIAAKAGEITGNTRQKSEEHQETSQRKIDVEVEKRGETESNIIQNNGHCEKDRRAEIAETIFTAGSTIITAEEVKRRLLKERMKTKKDKLRIKGHQSAVRRGRQENQQLIREYAGWDQY